MDIVEELPCGVFIMDSRFRITRWNGAMELITGFVAGDLLGKSWQQLHFHNPGEREKRLSMADCLKNLEAGRVQKSAELRCRDGLFRLVFLSVRVMPETGGVLATVADLSRTISCDQVVPSELEGKTQQGAWGMVGKSEAMASVFRLVELAAEGEVTVLITGESGTGKEKVAEAIHRLSPRRGGPYLRLNCAALSENLLESELFGHVKGAFTGAVSDKRGYFEAAEKGTLFLDEIGDISPLLQVRLLRVLQERVVNRVGDHRERKVDIRLVAATNRDLKERVAAGLFREDLYYRLSVLPVHLPSLRHRVGDTPLLLSYFLRRLNLRTGKSISGFTEGARRLLLGYPWPGNIRELENALEHAFVVCDRSTIDTGDLPPDLRTNGAENGWVAREKISAQNERKGYPKKPGGMALYAVKPRKSWPAPSVVQSILEKHGGNRTRAASELGVSTVALWRHMKSWAG